jgi:ectoine hydroxylase-related dioxygenase (phytanoyl-CoA dioxygenase family)
MGEGCFVPRVRNFTKLQGVLGLSSTTFETGGFQAVCGFHRHIRRWCLSTPYNTNVDACSELLEHMQRVYQRAASVVIFNREIPHGIAPNVSEKTIRYAQYLRMTPESALMLDEL